MPADDPALPPSPGRSAALASEAPLIDHLARRPSRARNQLGVMEAAPDSAARAEALSVHEDTAMQMPLLGKASGIDVDIADSEERQRAKALVMRLIATGPTHLPDAGDVWADPTPLEAMFPTDLGRRPEGGSRWGWPMVSAGWTGHRSSPREETVLAGSIERINIRKRSEGKYKSIRLCTPD